jgi:hypothetical protein
LQRASRFARRHWKIAAAVLATAAILLAISPRLFDKSVEELIAWGNEQVAAGDPLGGLRAYARAYSKGTGADRRKILPLMLVASRSPSIKDHKQVGEALWNIVDVDPETSFQEFDYAIMQAWGEHHGGDLTSDAIRDDDKRRLLEFAEKRIQLTINGGYSTADEKKDAEKHLSMVRFTLSRLKDGSTAMFNIPTGLPPAHLLKIAAGEDEANVHARWPRGVSAFGAGIQLEATGENAVAVAAYRQAYELMRCDSPTYSGLSYGIDMGLTRDKQHEAREPRMLREVVRSIQRLDPNAPDPLRGGIRFRVVGPQFSRNDVIKLYAALWVAPIDLNSAPFGMRGDGNGTNMVPSPPGSFPIGIDGTAWIGVADGKYRLSVFRGEWGGIDGPPDPNAAKGPVELDLSGLPKEVEIKGETIEIKIPSYGLQTVDLTAPADGEAIDFQTVTLRWSSLPRAKTYAIQFGHKEQIPGGVHTNFVLGTKTDATILSPADLSAAERAKLKPLKQGSTGQWAVTAYNADGRKIGASASREFRVLRALEEK